jgi:mannosyltransferase
MSLQIDGIVFSLQRHGGISVYFRELAACLERQQAAFTLTLEAPVLQDSIARPSNLDLRGARLLERVRSCRTLPGTTVFHSSYYRRPADGHAANVVTVYDFIHERFRTGWSRRAFMMQKRSAIRSAQAVICISQATRDDLEEWIGTTREQSVHVIHCGVGRAFRPVPRSAPDRPYVLYVGERRGYKNFRAVLEAMAWLPDLELHCIGGGDLRDEEMHHAPPSVWKRVKHLGFVDDEALNDHYNGAVCLAYPSTYEGFGIPVAEAMRAGCPVVAAASCKAVVEVGGAALTLADPVDPKSIAEAILRIIDPAERATVVQTGLQIGQAYDWDAQHQRTLDVYRDLGWRHEKTRA